HETTREVLAEAGYRVTDRGVAAMRGRVGALEAQRTTRPTTGPR
ncbi:MAG: hypothetical protein QOE03_3522, partial [Micromonosporaceae bacterium]|nr:hypothetical protein [Micromonosporaceae bacterium]